MARSGHTYQLREHGKLYYLPAKISNDIFPIVDHDQDNKDEISSKPWALFEWCCERDSILSQ
eukprot:11599784-Heterocapsa_arctica.AAC.2